MSVLQALDLRRRSASSVPPPVAGKPAAVPVAKLIDVSKCIGCKACQTACLEWNQLDQPIGFTDGTYNNPTDLTTASWTVMRFTEYEQGADLEWLIRKDGCMHCADPGCLKACPQPGAIIQYANGIVDFQSEQCIGCGYCIAGCPFDVPRISKKDNKAYKCTLCVDRVSVGQEPACVKTCPTGAINFGGKDDMKHLAAERVRELHGRGFAGAGLYDPQGVGGTHVMYVLQHADKPHLYHKLPTDPRISGAVQGWKGWLKPVAAAAFFATLAGTVFHYVGVGPNEVDEEETHDEETHA